jgi:hypothetical protein
MLFQTIIRLMFAKMRRRDDCANAARSCAPTCATRF